MTTTTEAPGGHRLRLPQIVILLSLVAALQGGFVGISPFKLGYWEAESVTAFLHATAALTALGLGWLAVVDPARVKAALAAPVVWPPLALALWGGLTAPFAEYPWLSIFGAPQTAEGPLLQLDIAIWIMGGLAVRGVGRAGWVVAAAAALPAIAMPLTFQFLPAWRLFFYPDWMAFYGLTAPAIVAGFLLNRGTGERWLNVGLAVLVVALVPLAISGNRTAIAAAATAVPICLILARFQILRPFWNPLFGIGLLILPAAAFAFIWIVGGTQETGTLWSRMQAMNVSLGAFDGHFWRILVGEGWGHDMFTMIRHLDRADANRFYAGDNPWDLALRDYFHSHHGGFEALLSVGVPGAVLYCFQSIALALTARPNLRWLAGATAASLALTLCFWFQTAITMPFQALAFAAVARPGTPNWQLHRVLGASAFSFIFLALIAAATFLVRFGLPAHRDFKTWEMAVSGPPPSMCASYPDERWRGQIGLARIIGGRITHAEILARREGWTPDRTARLAATICLLEQRLKEPSSVYLIFWGLDLRGRIAHLDIFDPLRPNYVSLLDGWAPLVDRLIARAPHRSDLAISYFGWAIAQKRYAEAIAVGDRILQSRAEDPIALWFTGNAILFNPDPAIARQGLRRMQRALSLGVDTYAPIELSLKERVLAQ